MCLKVSQVYYIILTKIKRLLMEESTIIWKFQKYREDISRKNKIEDSPTTKFLRKSIQVASEVKDRYDLVGWHGNQRKQQSHRDFHARWFKLRQRSWGSWCSERFTVSCRELVICLSLSLSLSFCRSLFLCPTSRLLLHCSREHHNTPP